MDEGSVPGCHKNRVIAPHTAMNKHHVSRAHFIGIANRGKQSRISSRCTRA